jgi:hypothetical protein
MVVLIEWRPSKKRVTVRGCWPRDDFKPLPVLEPGNTQHDVQVFEGVDMKSHVGFEGLIEECSNNKGQTQRPAGEKS